MVRTYDECHDDPSDVRCDPEEKCFPMIPAGAAAIDIIEAPGGEVVPA